MAKIKEESLQLNIIINGDQGQKKLLELNQKISETTDAISKLKEAKDNINKSMPDYQNQIEKLNADIKKEEVSLSSLQKEYQDTVNSMNLSTMTMEQLQTRANGLRKALNQTVPGTENWKRLNSSLSETKNRIAEVKKQARSTKQTLSTIYKSLSTNFIGIEAAFSVFSRLIGGFDNVKKAFLDYDEALTDAVKTTGRTKEEISEISDELSTLDTKTAQNELLGLVRAGGKLGISAKEDLIGFAKAADKINVALADDLGGNAEAAITAIGKMSDIFHLNEQYGIETAMLKVGSAINELGMASTANEGYIVDFSQRLAGIAPNANISIDKVLGMAATLDKYGQQAETSSTAVGQTITAMFKRTEVFANIAKMSVKDFSELLSTDVNEAFIRVLEGMKQGQGGLASVTAAMEEMHLNGSRAATVLGTLSKNSDELRRQQEIANDALSKGTSIIDEFNTKNVSATAIIEKQKKELLKQQRVIGEQLLPVQIAFNRFLGSSLGILSKNISLLVKYKATTIALIAIMLAYKNALKIKNALQLVGNAIQIITLPLSRKRSRALSIETAKLFANATATKANTTATKENTTATKENATATKKVSIATAALSVVQNILAGNFSMAYKALKLLGIAFKDNPFGGVLAVISALATAGTFLLDIFRKNIKTTKETSKAQSELKSAYVDVTAEITKEQNALGKLERAVLNAKIGSKERAAAIKAINEKYGEYLPNLLSEKNSNEEVATALKNVNLQLVNKLKLQAREKEEQNIFDKLNSSVKDAEKNIESLFKHWQQMKLSPEQIKTVTNAINEYKNSLMSGKSATVAFQNLKKTLVKSGLNLEDVTQYGFQGYTYQTNKEAELKSAILGVESASSSALKQKALLDGLYGSPDDLNNNGLPPNIGKNSGNSDRLSGETFSNKPQSSWSLNSDNNYLKDKAELTKKYNNGEIADKEDFEKRLYDLEVNTYKRRISVCKSGSKERIELEDKLQDIIMKHNEEMLNVQEKKNKETEELSKAGAKIIAETEQDKIKVAMDAEEVRYNEEKRRFEQSKIEYENRAEVLAAIELKHKNNVNKILLDAETKRLSDMEAAHNLERQMIVTHYSKLRLSSESSEKSRLKNQEQKDLLQSDIKYLGELKANLEKLLKNKDILGLSPEAIRQYTLELAKAEEELNNLKGQKVTDRLKGTGGGSLFGVSQSQWQQFFDNIKEGKTGMAELGVAASAIGDLTQEGFRLAAKAITATTAKENIAFNTYLKNNEKRKKALKERFDEGLMTEQQYNAEIAAMEETEQARQEELRIQQAERQKKLDIIQAIINTAVSVTKTLAQFGIPAGIAPAAIAGAMGAAQIAMIAAQPVSGAEEGGFVNTIREQDGKPFKARLSPNKRGFISTPTVLVGEAGGEYVIPSDGLKNPSLKSFIGTIETARKAGTLKQLNFEAVYPVSSVMGRAAGGYTSETSINKTEQQQSNTLNIGKEERRLVEAIELLNKRLSVPITAEVAMMGKKGIIEQTEKYNRAKSRGYYD